MFRRVRAFDAFLDFAGSVFGWLFHGTLTGMAIAAIATDGERHQLLRIADAYDRIARMLERRQGDGHGP